MGKVRKTVLYVILLVIAFFMITPFYMMFVMSSLSTNEIYSFPPHLVFGNNLAQNFKNMMGQIDIVKAFLNSCLVTFSSTFLSLLFCSMGGYAFAAYEFPGKRNYLHCYLEQ